MNISASNDCLRFNAAILFASINCSNLLISISGDRTTPDSSIKRIIISRNRAAVNPWPGRSIVTYEYPASVSIGTMKSPPPIGVNGCTPP